MNSIKLKKSDCIFMSVKLFRNYIINSNDSSFNLYNVDCIKYQNRTFKLQHYTIIDGKKIVSYCPYHGNYTVYYDKESNKLEYNTPLRNLVRGMLYGTINNDKKHDYEIIRITGGDYSGFYQEELLYKVAALCKFDVSKLPIILYCPQILDWSGAKLSKSLYVSKGAYSDLPGYLLNYKELYKSFGYNGLQIIHNETDLWLEEPYRLFRNYTVYYFIKLFDERMK